MTNRVYEIPDDLTPEEREFVLAFMMDLDEIDSWHKTQRTLIPTGNVGHRSGHASEYELVEYVLVGSDLVVKRVDSTWRPFKGPPTFDRFVVFRMSGDVQ